MGGESLDSDSACYYLYGLGKLLNLRASVSLDIVNTIKIK